MSILVVNQPTFQRAMRVISSITRANPAVVTTTTDHQYITGMIVRLNIPKGFGMQQANQLKGEITIIDDTSFSIDIDTSLMDRFLELIIIDFTDSSGNASGTILSGYAPFTIGQSFTIGDDFYLVIASNGALYCNGQGAGTFNTVSGDYTFTGAPSSDAIYFNRVLYPLSYQFAQCTPIGENSSTLQAATQNVLGTSFYS